MGVAFSLVPFFWPRKRKVLRRRAHIPAGDADRHPEAVYANPPIGVGAQMRDKHMDSLLSYMQTKSAWFQVG